MIVQIKRRTKKRMVYLLAIVLSVTLAGGVLAGLLGVINADYLGYEVMSNHAPPSAPGPSVFGPDKCAWSHLQDHFGNDTAYTPSLSRAFTGVTTPNHVYMGSNSLVFQGYDSHPRLDYVFAEEYAQFESVSFTLRPIELSMHVLSQSGFFFNGKIDGGEYTGYALMMETVSNDTPGADPLAQYANLRLYYVTGADLTDADAFALGAKSLISTYAVNLSSSDVWPISVRVECDAVGLLQVFIDGELRTRDLVPVGQETGFGFFAGYTDHDCTQLTVTAYSNLQISVPWVQKSATATVRFINKLTGQPLADHQTINGVTGQRYAINPPGFSGFELIEREQKLLDPIPYFSCDGSGTCDCNETILYYTPKDKAGSYKEATYEGAQNNGTAKNPVPVEHTNPKKTIEYSVHAGGNGQWHYGAYVVTSGNLLSGGGTVSMGGFGDPVAWEDASPNNNYGQGGQNNAVDVALVTPSTNKSGNMTIDSNYPVQIGKIQTPASASGSGTNNDGVVVGFRPAGSGVPLGGGKLYTTGNNGAGMLPIAHSPNCVGSVSGNTHTHTHNAATRAAHPGALASCGCSVGNAIPKEERYIKLTFNNLRNDAGYVFDFFLGDWDRANPGDYIIRFIGNDSLGNPLESKSPSNPAVVWRAASGLFSTNSGNSIGVTPTIDMLPALADYTEVSAGGGNGFSYIYPINGKIEVIFTRLHNNLHCHNIVIGAGQSFARLRQTIVTVIDYLPPGTTYVPGSSGQYEANLISPRHPTTGEILKNPDGSTTLTWVFGVLPPDGYDIPIQVTIDREGLFVNSAQVIYGSQIPMTSTSTNNTYHQTGDPVGVTEHFLDYNDPGVTLKGDRFISMPPGDNYVTSVESMSDILYNGNTYRYVGYKRIAGAVTDSDIQLGVPPNPTIAGVAGGEEIELYFAKNPLITVEFRDLATGAIILRPDATFPVRFGDPFFIPDSVRDPIEHNSQIYNYCAYAKTEDGTLLPIEFDAPGKPIYPVVTEDQKIVVYFTTDLAVTVRYVEYGQPANVLKNNDYFLVGQGGSFSVAPEMMSPINSVGKRYVYEGWSYPGNLNNPTLGPPPDPAFSNIQNNEEIILHFSTVYLITLKYHEDIPYADDVVYDELLPPVTLTIRAGSSFDAMAQAVINYQGYSYNSTGQFKWETDARPAITGSPHIAEVHGDYTVIFLYNKDVPQTDHSVVVMYREFGNTANILLPDDHYFVANGGNFSVGTPPNIPGYTYYAYSINRDPIQIGYPDNPTFTNVDTEHVIILQYIPDGYILERFRELGNEGNILINPDRPIRLPGSGLYTPESWVPPPQIRIDAYTVYNYHGYRVDGGQIIEDYPPTTPFLVNGEITYLYTYEDLPNKGGAMFAKADAEDNGAEPGWDDMADTAALELLLTRLAGAKFKVYSSKANAEADVYPIHFTQGQAAESYFYSPAGTITEITTGSQGIFMLYGFPVAGITYWIKETQAPEDYLLEPEPFAFTVTANGFAPGCHALFDELIPEPIPYVLSAEKTTDGKEMTAGQFGFELWLSDEEGTEIELLDDTTANSDAGASSAIVFDAIIYERAGVYYYLLKEIDSEEMYWQYDGTVYLVKVEVINKGGGIIEVTAVTYIDLAELEEDPEWEDFDDGENPPVFANVYEEPTGDITFTGSKVVLGADAPNESFSFTITQASDADGTPMSPTITLPEPAQAHTSGEGGNPYTIPFTKIEDLRVNTTYYFVVTESGGGLGWTNDPEPQRVIIVTVDALGQAVIVTDGEEVSDDLDFTNSYEKPGLPFEFYKTDEKGNPMDGVTFTLYICTEPAHGEHDPLGEETGCWEPLLTAVSGEVDEEDEEDEEEPVPGRVRFPALLNGVYLLAETATKPGYQLPQAQWLITVDVNGVPPIEIVAFGGTPPGFMLDDGELFLANYPVLILPRAGSFTTLLLSAAGSALFGGAGVIAAVGVRRRKRRE